jgi:hypothetical protein
MNEMLQKNKMQKLLKKQLVFICNRNGIKMKLDRSDIYHIVRHFAWFISFINQIFGYDYNRKIPQKYLVVMCDVFHFNLQMGIHGSIEKIDHGFNLKIESYEKTISILSQQKRPDKNILFQTLAALKNDIENFCSIFREFDLLEYEIESFKGYWEESLDDWI